ncbi:MAG TPA: VOC family protein [Actinomycetota bacterium]|nr:VOC family protein [Actinomycetota bacterium]
MTFDCADPARLAAFWSEALGWERQGQNVKKPGGGIYLESIEVPEPKTVKNRLHLGLHADDLDAEIERLVALGATCLWEELFPPEWPYRNAVLCDPEGNEFCLGAEGARPVR